MTQHRILIIDDENDVRRVIELALSRDPDLAIRACGSGHDGVAEAASWSPDLILLDVMMPGMDGPTTLARLQANPATAEIPVVFLTARARPADLDQFTELGARGALAKPFVPKELRAAVKGHLHAAAPAGRGGRTTATGTPQADASPGRPDPLMSEAELRAERSEYLARLQTTVTALAALRAALRRDPTSPMVLDDLRAVAHRMAGSAGLYGFDEVSVAASRLEDSIIARRDSMDMVGRVDADIEALLSTIGREPAISACG